MVAGQRAMEERNQNIWEDEPRNQHLQSTSAVVLMHTKILELLGYRASEALCLDIRICKVQVLKSADAPDPSPQKS